MCVCVCVCVCVVQTIDSCPYQVIAVVDGLFWKLNLQHTYNLPGILCHLLVLSGILVGVMSLTT